MLVIVSSFANTNGVVFPNTEAINATGSGATDGTEFVKIGIDHVWGWSQALLNYAGLTPNGIQEADGASQLLEATGKGFAVGPGLGVTWWLNDDPATTGHRVLLLNGQGILRANYAELDAAVYVGDASNTAVHGGGGFYYRADNSDGTSPNIAGAYLILPETRGYALRGLDPSGGVDPGGASRFLGDVQGDGAPEISGSFAAGMNSTSTISLLSVHTGAFSSSNPQNNNYPTISGASVLDQTTSFAASASNSKYGSTTEMVMTNVSVKYGITY